MKPLVGNLKGQRGIELVVCSCGEQWKRWDPNKGPFHGLTQAQFIKKHAKHLYTRIIIATKVTAN